MNENFEESIKYIERVQDQTDALSVLSPEDVDLMEERFTKCLAETAFDREGEIHFTLSAGPKDKPTDCVIKYSSSFDPSLNRFLSNFSSPDTSPEERPDYRKFRKIENLRIENGQHSAAIGDLFEACSVYVYLDDLTGLSAKEKIKYCNAEVKKYTDNKPLILIHADLLSVFGIFLVLHELGHVARTSTITRIENIKLKLSLIKMEDSESDINPENREDIIRDERGASAFAINTLRRFLSKDDMGLITEIGIKRGIKSYLKSTSTKEI